MLVSVQLTDVRSPAVVARSSRPVASPVSVWFTPSRSQCCSSVANNILDEVDDIADTVAPAHSCPVVHKPVEDASPNTRPPRRRSLTRRKRLLSAATAARGPRLPAGTNDAIFRFWIEEQVIKNATSVQLIQGLLEELDGVRTGGPPKSAGRIATYGFMAMDRWDLLWTVTNKALRAAEMGLRPAQTMCVIPGMSHISRKSALPSSLLRLLGDGAWDVVPRSFSIPSELHAWQDWVGTQPDACRGQLWMLKNNQQRGVGLKLVTTEQALAAAKEKWIRRDSGREALRWLLLQRYVAQPYLINDRKFGIRAWVLVTDVAPMRAYLHGCGLALFSSHAYSSENVESRSGGIAPGHVTNYAQNQDGMVWNLAQLQDHMGHEAYSKVWQQIAHAAAAVCRACEPGVEEAMAKLRVPPHSCFQTLGLDFLLDADCKAWLLEVNATPSMAVVHSDPTVHQLILEQKKTFLRDVVNITGIPDRFQGGWPMHDAARIAACEHQRRGRFMPLQLATLQQEADEPRSRTA